MNAARIGDAGDSALLLQLDAVIDAEVNAHAIAIARYVRERAVPGVRDVVSTYRSVAVYFDPLAVSAERVRDVLDAATQAHATVEQGRLIEVPVVYGGSAGPDLAPLATAAGLSVSEVIERHARGRYRVFMLGFLPGFPYLGLVDESIAASRHASPRLRVAAGSVGIAGRQTGIYPFDSPGGWQIIGRTPLRVFDPARAEPAMFAPGDQVRFVPLNVGRPKSASAPAPRSIESDLVTFELRPAGAAYSAQTHGAADRHAAAEAVHGPDGTRTITVIRPGLFTTIQDLGRWGYQDLGVSVCGALDAEAHRVANALVGNDGDAATLEVTIQGPELRFDHDATIAIAGADLHPSIGAAPVAMRRALGVKAGEVLQFGQRRSGARAYVAFDGGIAAQPVLGSRATHMVTRLGGLDGGHLRAEDVLALGKAGTRRQPADSTSAARLDRTPYAAGGARLRVLRGPQADVFEVAALRALEHTRFTVTAQSNRMGYRLSGGAELPLADTAEMISDPTFVGAIQVPPSGDPILLLADRQTTGGYPQLAVVITADLPVAAQLAPGDWVEFRLCTRAEAVAALIAREVELRALA